MRRSFFILPFALYAGPAFAQQAAVPAPKTLQIPHELADPATADRIADTMQSLSKALLDMKVGRLQATLEGREPTRAERDRTVRDLARRDDPQIERHVQQRIAEAKPKIEQSIKAFNQALPEVTEDLQRAQHAVERAMANMPDPNYPKR